MSEPRHATISAEEHAAILARLAEMEAAQALLAERNVALEKAQAKLEDKLQKSEKKREKAEHERAQFEKLYSLVLFELERLKRQLFGQKAEKADPAQVQLAFEPVLDAMDRARNGEEGALGEAESMLAELRERAKEMTRRRDREKKGPTPHGRRDLSLEDLPVETIVIEPPERMLEGGEALVRIGKEVSEHVDRRPASLIRVRVVRPKYKDPRAETRDDQSDAAPIVIAEMPERPIPRGMAGPGLLAHVLMQKFGDHIPLHRQEKIFKREGLPLPRSTLAGWVETSTRLLKPIVEAMLEDAKATARWICIDAMGALVQAKDKCRRGHFWVLVAERDHVLYRYTKTGAGKEPKDLLAGYSGYVIADASSVYHELYRESDGITEVGCWAHGRRKFFEALPSDRDRALAGIGFIGLLYDAHRRATDPETGIVDASKRKALAAPVLAELDAWIGREKLLTLEDAPIRKAMQSLDNHRVPMRRFLEDGNLRLDNNLAELELRRAVIGRKNWLFCGSDDGAHWNTIAVSLIASCELHGIEPWAYLRDVLTLLPTWPSRRVLELSPKLWNQTREKDDTRKRLRDLTLLGRDEHPERA